MSKRVLRALLGVVMIFGIVIALWPLGQSVYAQWNQTKLQNQWQASRAQTENKKQKAVHKKQHSPLKSKSAATRPKAPWPATRLVIPEADVDVVVLDGWDESTLKKAPGHWPASALPGEKGNCAIAGHRNVYGSPFYKVDSLMGGAPIELRTPDATYVYRVVEVKAVADSDTTVLQPSTDPATPPVLTLVTCTIPRTASRIIVSAQMDAPTGY